MATDIETLVLAVDASQVKQGQVALDKLTESGKNTEDAAKKVKKATDDLAASMQRHNAEVNKAQNATQSFLSQLERQIAIHGKSATEVLRYDSFLLGMTKTQREYADTLLKTISAQEKSAQMSDVWSSAITKASDSQKQATTSTSLLATAVKGLVAVYGSLQLASQVRESALLHARYETLGVSMTVIGKNAGYTAEQMEAAARSLQKTGISMLESRSAAMKLVQAHIDLADSSKLARIAQDAAVIGNMNSSEAFGALVHGIQSAQVEILRNIGINVSFEEGYKKTAEALHKTTNELTENEKVQSRLNQVMEKGKDIAGVYEASMDTAGKQLNSMKRYTEDLSIMFGQLFNETLTIAVMGLTGHLKDANQEARNMAANNELKAWMQDVTNFAVALADNVNNAYLALKLLGTTGAMVVAMGNTTPFGAGPEQRKAIMAAYEADVRAIEDAEDRYSKALNARRGAQAEKEKVELAEKSKRNEQFQKITAYYTEKYKAGTMSEITYLKNLAEVTKAFYGDNHKYQDTAVEKTKKATKDKVTEYEKLDKKLKELTGRLSEQLAVERTLSAAEKISVEVKQKLTAAEQARIKPILELAIAKERQLAAEKVEQDAMQRQLDSMEKLDQQNQTIRDGTKAMRDQTTEIGLSAEALLALKQARIDDEIAEHKRQLRILESSGFETDATKKIRETIAALEDRKVAMGEQFAKQQATDTAKQQTEEWKRGWEETDKLARETFTNWAEGGGNAAKKIGASLKKALLSAMYEATLKPLAFNIYNSATSALGMPGVGGSGNVSLGTGASLLDKATSINMTPMSTGLEKFSQTKIGGELFGGRIDEAAYADAVLRGEDVTRDAFRTATTDLGSAAQSFSQAVDAYGGYVNAAYQLTQGNPMQAIGSAVGQYFGGPIGATIGNFIGSMIGGKKGVKEVSLGNLGQEFSASGSVVRTDYNQWSTGDVGADRLAGLEKAYQSLASSIGAKTVNSYFSYGANNGGPDGAMQFAMGGGAGGKNFYQAETAASESALKLAASRAVFTALQGSELPEDIAKLFKGMTAGAMSASEIDSIIAKAQEMHKAIAAAQASQKTIAESLVTDSNSVAEKTKRLAEGFGALDKAVPTTAKEFSDLVLSLDVTKQSGQGLMAAYASMIPVFNELQAAHAELANQMSGVDDQLRALDMSPLVKQLADMAKATADAIDKATKLSASETELSKIRELSAKQANALVASQAASAYSNLLTASGDKVGAAKLGVEQKQSAYDSALQSVASAFDISLEKAKAYVSQMGGDLSSSSAIWKEMDEAGISLTDARRTTVITFANAAADLANAKSALASAQTEASKASATVAETTATTVDNSAAIKAAEIAKQKRSLEIQLMEAQGDAAGALAARREDELNAMDDSLRGIQKQIWAAQDLTVANEKAAAAAKKVLEDLQTATTSAFSALQKAVGDEKSKLTDKYNASVKSTQESINKLSESTSKLSSLSSALKSALNNMVAPGSELASRTAAQAQIQTALAIARAGGVLPTSESLAPALGVLNKPSEQFFTNFQDYQRDFILTSNSISDLAGMADQQLTDAQKQTDILRTQLDTLKTGFDAETLRLDLIVSQAQAQIDAANGTTNAVLGMSQALTSFTSAVQSLASARGNSIPAAISTSPAPAASVVASNAAQSGVSSAMLAAAKAVYQSATGGVSTAVMNAAASAIGATDTYDLLQKVGYNGDPSALKAKYGFASGINYVPSDMTANIHEGERIVPKADNREIINTLASRTDGKELAEIKAILEMLVSGSINNNLNVDKIRKVLDVASNLGQGALATKEQI